jgi:glyoxylase-like metal-dependent hydrolase (beta-lactamase superfamily II)
MQLADHVHALPTVFEFNGREMTVHPVAIETPRGLLLLDAGPAGVTDQLADGLAEHGHGLADVAYLVLTHQDFDHVGGAAAVVEAAGPVVLAHADDAPFVDGTRDLLKSPGGVEIPYDPVPVDVELQDGERFRTDAGPLEAIFTPGHTPGHTSFYLSDERLLLTGDAMNSSDGLGLPPVEATPDMDEAKQSIRRLADLDVERVHCYHGGPVEAGPKEIEAVADADG